MRYGDAHTFSIRPSRSYERVAAWPGTKLRRPRTHDETIAPPVKWRRCGTAGYLLHGVVRGFDANPPRHSRFAAGQALFEGMQVASALLDRLSSGHRIDIHFEWIEVAGFNELNRSTAIQGSIRSIEKLTCCGFVSSKQLHQRHPNPVDAAQFRLQAARVRMLANPGSFPANRDRNRCYWHFQFASNPCSVETSGLRVEELRSRNLNCLRTRHFDHLRSLLRIVHVASMLLYCIANVAKVAAFASRRPPISSGRG